MCHIILLCKWKFQLHPCWHWAKLQLHGIVTFLQIIEETHICSFFCKFPHRLTGRFGCAIKFLGGGGRQQEHLHQPGILHFYLVHQFRQQHRPHPYQQDSYCEHLFCRYWKNDGKVTCLCGSQRTADTKSHECRRLGSWGRRSSISAAGGSRIVVRIPCT